MLTALRLSHLWLLNNSYPSRTDRTQNCIHRCISTTETLPSGVMHLSLQFAPPMRYLAGICLQIPTGMSLWIPTSKTHIEMAGPRKITGKINNFSFPMPSLTLESVKSTQGSCASIWSISGMANASQEVGESARS